MVEGKTLYHVMCVLAYPLLPMCAWLGFVRSLLSGANQTSSLLPWSESTAARINVQHLSLSLYLYLQGHQQEDATNPQHCGHPPHRTYRLIDSTYHTYPTQV